MDLSEMLKEAQKLQKDMENITAQLETEEIQVANDLNTVRISITGSGKIKRFEINDEFLKGDPRAVETQILSTVQKALETARKKHEEAMKKITENLSLPSLDEMQSQMQVKGPTRRTSTETRFDV